MSKGETRRVETEDGQLMLAVQAGDVAQLSVLFERHHRRLFRFFVRLSGDRQTAEDLVQEVFFRMLKYRLTYTSGGQFIAWMYRIARNVHLDGLARQREEAGAGPEDALESAPSAGPGPEERLRSAQQVQLLRRALHSLPVEKREVLVLSRYQNLKYDEIASVLNCEVGAVKVRVYRALKELGQAFFLLAGEKAS